MANASETADDKAAKAKADKEAKAAKAKADEEAKAAKAARRADKSAIQTHHLTREVKHDGEDLQAGDEIELTRAQHAQLYAVGAVADDWQD